MTESFLTGIVTGIAVTFLLALGLTLTAFKRKDKKVK